MLKRVLEMEDTEALAFALVEWGRTRAPEIAQAVRILGARCEPEPPVFRRKARFQAHWLERARKGDPVWGGWLGRNLVHWIPGRSDDQLEPFLERLEALEGWCDPRISAQILVHIEANTAVMAFSDAGDGLRAHLVGRLDANLLEEVRALATRANKWEAPLLVELADEIGDVPVELDKGARAAWREAFPVRDAAEILRQRQQLCEGVAAAPDDANAQAVLVDFLLEHDDPLGEFMALQILEDEGLSSIAETRRAEALLKAHRTDWLGSLAAVVHRAWFRRGLLDVLELDGTWAATQEMWNRHAADPLLRTVRKLGGKAKKDIVSRFIAGGQLQNLREIAIDPERLAVLVEHPLPRLEVLDVVESRSLAWVEGDVRAFMESHGCLGVRVHAAYVSAVDGLALEHLGLYGDVESGLAHWSLRPTLKRLEVGWSEVVTIDRLPDGDCITIPEGCVDSVGALPPSVRKVRIVSKKLAVEAMQARFSGVEVFVSAPPRRSGKVTGLRR